MSSDQRWTDIHLQLRPEVADIRQPRETQSQRVSFLFLLRNCTESKRQRMPEIWYALICQTEEGQ